MAPDFAVYFLTQPIGVALQIALLLGPLLVMRVAAPKAFGSVGLRRLVFAHLGVAVAVFLLSVWSAYSIGSTRVNLGHIEGAEFYSGVARSSVYLFVLVYVFALALASLVLAPLCVWLFPKDRATVQVFAALGALLALSLGGLSVAFPGNDWGQAHRLGLFASTLASVGLGAFLVCLAFAVGAGLPIRNRRTAGAI